MKLEEIWHGLNRKSLFYGGAYFADYRSFSRLTRPALGHWDRNVNRDSVVLAR